MMKIIPILLTVAMSVAKVTGHGYLLQPPARNTMWRSGFASESNYNDNALNCGGSWVSSISKPQRQKTYLRTCAPSEDSDQPAHSRSLIRIFPWRILDS